MAVNIFLDIQSIKGESMDAKHKDTIDVLSWSRGMSQTGTTHIGGGGGAGKVNVQDLSLTKYVDSASTALMKCCCTGEHLNRAKLIVRKAGLRPLEYLTIEMQEVMVTAIPTGGSGSDDRLTENVTLNFRDVKTSYQRQRADGSGGPKNEFRFDIAANESA